MAAGLPVRYVLGLVQRYTTVKSPTLTPLNIGGDRGWLAMV